MKTKVQQPVQPKTADLTDHWWYLHIRLQWLQQELAEAPQGTELTPLLREIAKCELAEAKAREAIWATTTEIVIID